MGRPTLAVRCRREERGRGRWSCCHSTLRETPRPHNTMHSRRDAPGCNICMLQPGRLFDCAWYYVVSGSHTQYCDRNSSITFCTILIIARLNWVQWSSPALLRASAFWCTSLCGRSSSCGGVAREGSSISVVGCYLLLQTIARHHWLATSFSGCGKSSLLRVMRQLWTPLRGTAELCPNGSHHYILFLPQRPYLTTGSLADQVGDFWGFLQYNWEL